MIHEIRDEEFWNFEDNPDGELVLRSWCVTHDADPDYEEWGEDDEVISAEDTIGEE